MIEERDRRTQAKEIFHFHHAVKNLRPIIAWIDAKRRNQDYRINSKPFLRATILSAGSSDLMAKSCVN